MLMEALNRQETKEQWLQIKGDPSIRNFLFQQTRVTSEFDLNIDYLLEVVEALLTRCGIFHVAIHFSSNQLTCWSYQDPYRYHVYVGNEVLTDAFLKRFRPLAVSKPAISNVEIRAILLGLKQLRFKDENAYLRIGSINIVNGIIGLSFSCDGSHYLSQPSFNRLLKTVEPAVRVKI